MRRVDEITGQERVAERIAQILNAPRRQLTAIIGPEGSGKTRAAGLVAARLREQHRVVFRRGDALLSKSPEAMLLGPPVKPSAEEVGGTVLDIAQDVGDLIAEGHIPFSRTLRRLFKLKSKGDQRLSQRQQAFVFELSVSRFAAPVLLIADNLHYWDSASLHFLAQLHQGVWDDVYPGLRRLRIVLVWTPEQAGATFLAEVKRLFGQDLHLESLRRVGSSEFSELLTALGAPEGIPANIVQDIYAASGGHLLFASQIVSLLRTHPLTHAVQSIHEPNLGAALRAAIEARLDQAGAEGILVRRLIQAISIIGVAARPDDLACILDDERHRIEWIVDQAMRFGFVERSADEIAIAHDVIRRVVLTFLTPDQRAWHQRFAVCLATLRPWDYSRRAVHCSAAQDDESSQAMRVMGLLQGVREMKVKPEDDWLAVVAPVSERVHILLSALQSSAVAESDRRYDDAIVLLERVPTDVDPRIGAERDVILARLLLLKRTAVACERAIALLDDLESFRETEPDLWWRIEELRIVVLAYLGRYDAARRAESELQGSVRARAAFDPAALHVDNRLRRKAESVHAPRIANDRLRKALAYYDPSGDGSAPRDLVEYVLTLNNLGANELVLGDFDSAFERFARCYTTLAAAVRPIVRRIEIILSNLVVAHFLRTGVVPQSISVLDELTAPMELLSSDAGLVRSNVAALLALKGEHQQARRILADASARILTVDGFSEYTIYFVCSNLAVTSWLTGEDAAARRALQRAVTGADDLEPHFRPYAKRRLEILDRALVPAVERDLHAVAAAFRPGQPQIGEGWRFYGRPIGVTDLQFWTEG